MNNTSNGTIEISKALIGCIGVALAATISGIFLLISSGVIKIDGVPAPSPSSTLAGQPATHQPLVIDGAKYPYPNLGHEPYCIAQEIHTQGRNKVDYRVVVPKGWVMIWDSYKAYWPNGKYEDSGLLAIYGEWSGTITIDSGGSCSVPIEWADFALQNRRGDYSLSSRPEFYIGEGH